MKEFKSLLIGLQINCYIDVNCHDHSSSRNAMENRNTCKSNSGIKLSSLPIMLRLVPASDITKHVLDHVINVKKGLCKRELYIQQDSEASIGRCDIRRMKHTFVLLLTYRITKTLKKISNLDSHIFLIKYFQIMTYTYRDIDIHNRSTQLPFC